MKYFLLFLVICCSHIKGNTDYATDTFRYQLHGYSEASLERIIKSQNTFWVIDESKSADSLFTSSDLKKFKKNSNTLISYMSLGEAEKYRSYFHKLPKDIIIGKNPHWEDNYTIRYWRKEWGDIVRKRLEILITTGFDGVIYDVVDAFAIHKEKHLYAQKMANLILETAFYAKSKNPDFHIILQNASVLFDHLPEDERAKVIKVISGASIESVLFENAGPSEGPIINSTTQNFIDGLKAENKWIFSLEYLQTEKQINDYIALMNELGIYGLVTDKSLKGDFFISNEIKN